MHPKRTPPPPPLQPPSHPPTPLPPSMHVSVGLHMPGQVGLLCKIVAASLAGEHGHGLSKKTECQ